MKKALKIIGIIVVVIFLILLIIPIAFKGKIVELIKKEANKNLKAEVNFTDVDLSLIRSFPNLSVSIDDLSVIGVEPFAGDTLAYMEALNLTLDVMSVIKGDEIQIKKIQLNKPNINVLVLEDGTANYDIAVASEEAEEEPASDEGGGAVSLNIDKYEINDGHIVYNDATLPMVMAIHGLTHTGKGNFAEEVFTLYTETHIDKAILDYDGVRYINGASADLDADIAMDLPNMKFTFMENEFRINELALGFNGWLAMPADDIDMDITFDAKKNDLKTLLSLIPAEFAQEIDDVKADGKISLSGFVKGVYNDNSMPGFALNLGVENGSVHYPDLPRSIENIQIKADINSPEGSDMNKMTVDIPKFHMEIGKSAEHSNTIDARLSLRNPMTDPLIDTKVDADLNLGSFKDVIPMEEEFSLAGILNAHFELKGALSAIEQQQFNDFKAAGNASLANFAYADTEVKAEIPVAKMTFTPQKLSLETLKVIYEGINMSMDGYMNNYVAYALTDTTLQGVFNFKADKIDANKLMGDEETPSNEESASTDASAVGEPVLVPGNLDIILNTEIGEIKYDSLIISNMRGAMIIKNETVALSDLLFNLLGGSAKMSGVYNTQNHAVPKADFAFDVENIDIAQSATAFSTVEKYAPIARQASGKISSKMSIKTDLTADFSPVYETMNGKGTLKSKQVVLEGGKFLKKLSETLKSPKLAKQNVQDISASFVIKDGKITTDPFPVKIDKMEAVVSGYSSFDETMDYNMAMKIPRSELGGDFNKMADGLLSSANAFLGGNMTMGENINVDVRIHGNIADPEISPSFGGMDGVSVKDQAKEAVKEAVNEKIDEGKEKAREEAAKQAEKILADAQKQADKVKAEAKKAADNLRNEADKQAQKLIDDASNPLAKQGAKIAADQVRKQAEKQASNIESEAAKTADGIMAKARTEADKIKNE